MSALHFLSSQGTHASIIYSVFWVFNYTTGSFPQRLSLPICLVLFPLKFYISKSNSLSFSCPLSKSASPSWYRPSCTQWPEPETINPSLFNQLPHPSCYLLTLVPLYCRCLFNLELYQIWFENSYSLIQRFTTLAVQWNYLGSHKKCQCLGLTPRASDIIELESTWAPDC